MFKKLRKRRMSFSFKKKSSSLKNINIVETFVHETAKIMSASAESLDLEAANSNNLVLMLNKSFQSSGKCEPTPLNNIGSPQYKAKSYNQSLELNRKEKTVEREDVSITSCNQNNNNFSVHTSQDIEIIFEENNVTLEKNNNSSECCGKQYYCTKNYINLDIFISPQHNIKKPSLKRSYSFNDVNIKRLITLHKKLGTVQTFSSTSATLSTELILDNRPNNFYDQKTSDDNYDFEDTDTTETLLWKNPIPKTNNQTETVNCIFKGDDFSDLDDVNVEKEGFKSVNLPLEIINEKETYFKILWKITSHPLFIGGVVITGIIILVPVINKISNWFSDEPPEATYIKSLPVLKPLGPDFLFSSPLPPIEQLQEKFNVSENNTSQIYRFIPRFIKNLLRENSFISLITRYS